MITFLYVLYVMVCLFLILVVLLQAGRGGMGAAFGGSSQTVFGGSGAGNFLTKLTVISAALFMMLSATLTYVSSSGEKSLENATERVRLREEARGAASKDKKKADSAKKPAAPAPESTTETAPAAPTETAPAQSTDDKKPAPTPAPDQDKDQPAQP
jgi:preprotein translocase subunit SecG